MRRVSDVSLGDIGRGLARYKAVVATIAALVLLIVFLPGRDRKPSTQGVSAGPAAPATAGPATGQAPASPVVGSAPTPGQPVGPAAAGGAPGPASAPSAAVPAQQGTSSPAQAAGASEEAGASEPTSNPPLPASFGSDCDPATGRVKIPSKYAPECVEPFLGDNGGSTYQGVTGEKIVIAVYRVQNNPAVTAVFSAAGASDSQENVEADFKDYLEYFQKHYETYGRSVELVYVDASGPPENETAAKADALKVATEIKAFASLFDPSINAGGSYAYVDELVARGVPCIFCTYAQPTDDYLTWAPYVWPPTMTYHQSADLVAEYIGKRLWGKKAKWAGDPLYLTRDRTLGLVEYDNAAGDFSFGPDYYREALARWGARLDEAVIYPFDIARAQEQSRTMTAKLKAKEITTIIWYADPITLTFMSQEATRQNYRPEWLITGVGLTDTSFFARLFDTTQWAHAYGLGWSPARAPQEIGDAYRLHVWHHGRPPQSSIYGLPYAGLFFVYTGLHGAGPVLNPTTYRDGMFRYPRSGGGITTLSISWGRHGLWPYDDYAANEDVVEIWWDANAVGKDEQGADGRGLYRYVDAGKRYVSGQFPSEESRAFDPAGTVLIYNELPPGDKYPEYEHQKHT